MNTLQALAIGIASLVLGVTSTFSIIAFGVRQERGDSGCGCLGSIIFSVALSLATYFFILSAAA